MSKIHFPNLDALRTLAFLGVFFFHSFHTEYEYIHNDPIYQFVNGLFTHGDLGVNFFFVLSGFLITYLLLDERKRNDRIDLRKFYMRRVLRIWPLYFFTVFFGFVVFPVLKHIFGQIPMESADLTLFLFFLSNFNNIWYGLPDASMLGVLWSVSIEEQYYLVWPVLLLFFRNRLFLLAIPVLANVLFRYYFHTNGPVIQFHTFSVMSNLFVGSLLGAMVFGRAAFVHLISKISYALNAVVYIVFGTLIIFRDAMLAFPVYNALDNLIFSLFFGWVILEQIYSKQSFFKVGSIAYLEKAGKYTYGLYCLHFIGILISTNLTKLLGLNQYLAVVLLVETALALVLSHVIAFLSYHYFERPFLRIKSRTFAA